MTSHLRRITSRSQILPSARRLILLVAALICACYSDVDAVQVQVVHNFSANEGENPTGDLFAIGTTLYGVTQGITSQGGGTIYSLGLDGSGFNVLHTFPRGSSSSTGSDGNIPQGGLTAIGSKLFGTTTLGGQSASGTVFSIDATGANYQVLHNFSPSS